jgi:hypothetical protein
MAECAPLFRPARAMVSARALPARRRPHDEAAMAERGDSVGVSSTGSVGRVVRHLDWAVFCPRDDAAFVRQRHGIRVPRDGPL